MIYASRLLHCETVSVIILDGGIAIIGLATKSNVALSIVISHVIIRSIIMDEEKPRRMRILFILDPYKRDIT